MKQVWKFTLYDDHEVTEMPEGAENRNVFSSCGCKFESDTSNAIILCDECSELDCFKGKGKG